MADQAKKKAVKKGAKKKVEKRHPLGEKLKTIQKQIEQSEILADAKEFIRGLYEYSCGDNVSFNLREIFEGYVDKVEMFITEKDRISELVRIKLDLDVLSIRESNGRFTLQVMKDKKKETMYVEKKGEGYVYGIRNFEIGSL